MTKEEAIKILWRYDVNFEPYSAEAVIEAINMAVEAMQKQIDHIADTGKKVKQMFCSNCRNEAPEGKINSDCLMCMHLYGVHTQEANIEAGYESINFPKRDLFEPKKGIADSGRKVEQTAEIAQNVQDEDLIFRKAAIDALDEQIELCNRALGAFCISLKDEYAIKVERASLRAYKEQLKNLLSVQPEPCEDTISRQEAKNAICNACEKIDCDKMDTCKKLDIPSTGSKALEWQYHSYIPHNKYCPKCKKDSPYNKRWNFCPNCGAGMRKENKL